MFSGDFLQMCKTKYNGPHNITNYWKNNSINNALEKSFSQVLLIWRKFMAKEGHNSSNKNRVIFWRKIIKFETLVLYCYWASRNKLQYNGTLILQSSYFGRCKIKKKQAKLSLMLLNQDLNIYKRVEIVIDLVFWILYYFNQDQWFLKILFQDVSNHLFF